MSSPRPPSYGAFYGPDGPPFSVAPDGRFPYPSGSYVIARDQLTESLRRREGLMIVTGESGTGKTMLCRTVVQHAAVPAILSVIVDPHLEIEDVLRQILLDFGVISTPLSASAQERTSRYDLVTALHRFLRSIVPLDMLAVVMIDDAHSLRPELVQQLRALTNLETETAKLLQIVLVGQPGLEALLRRRELRQIEQRISRRCRLSPLEGLEVAPYLEHRLAAAERLGAGEPLRFMPAAVRTLAVLSEGIPRTINLICEGALEIACERQTRSISRAIVLESAAKLNVRRPISERVPRGRTLAVAISTILIAAGVGWVRTSPRTWDFMSAAERRAPPASPIRVSTRRVVPEGPAVTVSAAAASPNEGHDSIAAATLQIADAFLVVAGSFTSAERAAAATARIRARGLPAFVRADAAGSWHGIFVGPYATSDEARDAQRQIAGRDFPDTQIRLERR